MTQTISEFHYAIIFIDGHAFASAEALHQELAFKLGLPHWLGVNWNTVQACLSSIGKPSSNLCSHWEFRAGKRLVLQIRKFSADNTDHALLGSLLKIVADANTRLLKDGHSVSIWLEFLADTQIAAPPIPRLT